MNTATVARTVIQAPALDHDAMMLSRYGQKVSPNGKLERRIVANLIAHLESKGFAVVGVWDGEVFEKALDAKSAMEFIFNLDEASLRIAVHGTTIADDWRKTPSHGVFLVLGNGIDIISDWNYYEDDRDAFNAAMDAFDAEDFA